VFFQVAKGLSGKDQTWLEGFVFRVLMERMLCLAQGFLGKCQVPGMHLQGRDSSDSRDPIFSDSRDPMIIFSDSTDPNWVPETPLKNLLRCLIFLLNKHCFCFYRF